MILLDYYYNKEMINNDIEKRITITSNLISIGKKIFQFIYI